MEYTGTCYIGVVGPDVEPGQCRDSIERIARRSGDDGPIPIRATKGFEARQRHVNEFLASKHSFLLLLDHDMIFPADTLERLRRHKLPFVSGLYMRRDYQPIRPVWFRPWAGRWPMEPWIGPVERGRLHRLGASGWGCMLIHRAVFEATKPLLKGEPEIIEDDMDIWPYDLQRIVSAMRGIDSLLSERPSVDTLWPALEHHARSLREEIRPLRADRENVGSDLRYPWYAREAGFQLMGDPEVRCGHVLDYPLSCDDYDGLPADYLAGLEKQTKADLRKARSAMQARQEAVYGRA